MTNGQSVFFASLFAQCNFNSYFDGTTFLLFIYKTQILQTSFRNTHSGHLECVFSSPGGLPHFDGNELFPHLLSLNLLLRLTESAHRNYPYCSAFLFQDFWVLYLKLKDRGGMQCVGGAGGRGGVLRSPDTKPFLLIVLGKLYLHRWRGFQGLKARKLRGLWAAARLQ